MGAAQQVDVREPVDGARVHQHAADQHDAPVRAPARHVRHELEVDPVLNRPEEPDHGLGEARDVGGHRRARVERAAEQGPVHSVRGQVSLGVEHPLALDKCLVDREYAVHPLQQQALRLDHRAAGDVREHRPLVDAVVDGQRLPERSHVCRNARQEGPELEPPDVEAPPEQPHRGAEEQAVHLNRQPAVGERKHERREHPQVVLDVHRAAQEVAQLVEDAAHVAPVRQVRRAGPHGVEPQHAPALRQLRQHVVVGRRVVVPVLRERDDRERRLLGELELVDGSADAPCAPLPALGPHRVRARLASIRRVVLERALHGGHELVRGARDGAIGCVPERLVQRRRHHRQARGQVLAQLDRVDERGAGVHAIGDEAHVEAAAVVGQRRVRAPSQQVDVVELVEAPRVHGHAPDQHDAPVGAPPRHLRDQLEVDPVLERPVVAEHGTGQASDVVRHGLGAIERSSEQSMLHAMERQMRARVEPPLRVDERGVDGEHAVHAAQQLGLGGEGLARVHPGEQRELVHAVVHAERLAERADVVGHRGQEGPQLELLEPELPAQPSERDAEDERVQASRHPAVGKRDDDGSEDPQVVLHVHRATQEAAPASAGSAAGRARS